MRRGKPDWKSEAEDNLYRGPDGVVYQPSTHIEAALAKAAVPASVVLEILEDAGRRVGIGDYRPKFGRFQVVRFEVVKEKVATVSTA